MSDIAVHILNCLIEKIRECSVCIITDIFEKSAKVIINTTIQGIFAVDETITLKDNTYTVYALYAITPRSINTRLMNELREQQPEIYERFLLSKTYGEMEEEVMQYEKEVTSN